MLECLSWTGLQARELLKGCVVEIDVTVWRLLTRTSAAAPCMLPFVQLTAGMLQAC